MPEDLGGRVKGLEAAKGFDVTPEQRPGPTGEVGGAAKGGFRLSRDTDVGRLDDEKLASVRIKLGEEIHDAVWSILDLADLAGVELECAFQKKA
jgi:hypothetical protein